MLHNFVIGRGLLLCFAIFLPSLGYSAESVIEDGSSISTWSLYDASPGGAGMKVVRDPVFNSDSILFTGSEIQNAWIKNVAIEDPIVKFEMRTQSPGQDFEIVFFVHTTDGKRRISKYSTIAGASPIPPSVINILPSNLTDSNPHTISFNLKDDLLAGGIDYKEVYQVRVRGGGFILNQLSSMRPDDLATSTPATPTNLQYEVLSGSSVKLSWKASAGGADGYNINVNSAYLTTVTGGRTDVIVDGLSINGNYWASVAAFRSGKFSVNSPDLPISTGDARLSPPPVENPVTPQPLMSFDQVTGDDVIDGVEDDRTVVISGFTSGIENGQVVRLRVEQEFYTTTIQNNKFSFDMPSSDVQTWPRATTLVASAQNASGRLVVTVHTVMRELVRSRAAPDRGEPTPEPPVTPDQETGNPSGQPGGSFSDGMQNFSDQNVLDTRPLRAFPGAEGGGQFSVGGRGGALVVVDTLDCSENIGDGKTSVIEALTATDGVTRDARTILFSVGGFTDCGSSNITVVAKNITMACQSAPAPGVNIQVGRVYWANADNVIMRGCQWFTKDTGSTSDTSSGAFRVSGGSVNDMILDRTTWIGAVNDLQLAVTLNGDTHRHSGLTLSHSIVAESDPYSGHRSSMPASGNQNRYSHAPGFGCASPKNAGRMVTDCWFIGNFAAHNSRRSPKLWGASGGITGNFLYNMTEDGIDLQQYGITPFEVWFTDNVIKYGPNTGGGVRGNSVKLSITASAKFQSERNVLLDIDGNPTKLDVNGFENPLLIRTNNPPTTPPMTFHAPRAWATVADFDCVGHPFTDSNIDRIINEALTGTGEAGIGTGGDPKLNDANVPRHYETSSNFYPPSAHSWDYDTDEDGMQDAWEVENGLTVGIKDHNQDLDGDGYTNIEEFLNSLIRCN